MPASADANPKSFLNPSNIEHRWTRNQSMVTKSEQLDWPLKSTGSARLFESLDPDWRASAVKGERYVQRFHRA
jgi:hypothetical protein